MQILAIDTSTEFLSLALWLDGRVLSRDIHAGQTHSQQILPTLRELLDEANIDLKALDGVAFGAGPGSFTGLRIACGVAQGLAFGADLPVVAVSTLQALAQQSEPRTLAPDDDAIRQHLERSVHPTGPEPLCFFHWDLPCRGADGLRSVPEQGLGFCARGPRAPRRS